MRKLIHALSAVLVCGGVLTGCSSTKTSNTSRTSTEQLLISNSVDQALAKVDFTRFGGRAVYVEEKYLEGVDMKYVAASVRHRVLHAGARLVAKADDADVILEVRSGGIGTAMNESYIGVPEISLPIPVPISIPQVKLWNKTSQIGTAKIGILAYDARTRQALGSGGIAMAQSDDNNWYVLGIGPYQNGSVRSEVSRQVRQPPRGPEMPTQVAFSTRENDFRESRVRVTGGEKPANPFTRR